MKDETRIKLKALEDAKGRVERRLAEVIEMPGQRLGPDRTFADGIRRALRDIEIEIGHVEVSDDSEEGCDHSYTALPGLAIGICDRCGEVSGEGEER